MRNVVRIGQQSLDILQMYLGKVLEPENVGMPTLCKMGPWFNVQLFQCPYSSYSCDPHEWMKPEILGQVHVERIQEIDESRP